MLPRLVGVTRAADLLLSGRVFTAAETAEWGLWNDVAADGEATLGRGARTTRRLLATTVGPNAVHDDQAADLRRPAAPRRRRVDRRGAAAARRGDGARAEYREGVAALRERRPPQF